MSFENAANLPLSDRWRYRPYDQANFVLQPGQSRDFVDLRKHGWCLWAGVTMSNPNLSCVVKLESASEEYSNSFTCNDLMAANIVLPAASGWWVSRYDLINNVYSVLFSPSQWWPFYRRINVVLTNSTVAPITVFRAALLAIEFIEGPI